MLRHPAIAPLREYERRPASADGPPRGRGFFTFDRIWMLRCYDRCPCWRFRDLVLISSGRRQPRLSTPLRLGTTSRFDLNICDITAFYDCELIWRSGVQISQDALDLATGRWLVKTSICDALKPCVSSTWPRCVAG